MTDDDRVHLLYFRRAACLCDAGLSDYVAVATVAPDGQIATLWLWHRDGPDRAYPGDPPVHERTGPLPAYWNSRLARAAASHAPMGSRAAATSPGPASRATSTDRGPRDDHSSGCRVRFVI